VKTSETVERQEERKSAKVNGHSSRENRQPVTQKCKRGDASRIAAWAWKPGQSGNPGGRPKHDLACELAKAIFEENGPELYKAYLKAALRGNGYIFETLANRAFGKLKETVAVDVNPLRDLSDDDLKARIAELEHELGVPQQPAQLPPASDESKPN
jgi:hypothetical protein